MNEPSNYARPLGRPPGVNLHDCCFHGHPFTEQNTYIDPRRGRQCRACREARNRVWRKSHREQMRPYQREWMRARRLLMYLARDLAPYGREISEMSPIVDQFLRDRAQVAALARRVGR